MIIKKDILSELFNYISASQLFNTFQSAYRLGHKAETALLKVIDDLLHFLERGNVAGLTLLDLSAAFDTEDYIILLQRLAHVFGIHSTALYWLSSYLLSSYLSPELRL